MTDNERPRVLAIIPARGGSKGIPRKNLRSLGGRPLLSYAIGNALASIFQPDVFVTSEDSEILSLAAKLGARVQARPSGLADDRSTLDEVVAWVVATMTADGVEPYDVVVTLQPTSPLLRPASIDRAIQQLLSDPSLDSVLTATDDTHLTWSRRDGRFVPNYSARVNRQDLDPVYRETGGLIACRTGTLTSGSRIGPATALLLVGGAEAVDIDTVEDWALCEWYLSRRDILFVVAGSPLVGMGHVYNALTIANELVRHQIRFLAVRDSKLARDAIAANHYGVEEQRTDDLVSEILATGADVVINDRLDTTGEEIRALRRAGRLVVNFEDLGAGASEANLVINAIYPEREQLPRHYFGPRHFCLRSQFLLSEPRPVSEHVHRVLLAFGGVDPSDATRKVLDAIRPECESRKIEISVIAGLGYQHAAELRMIPGITVEVAVADMADRIRAADLVFTSAGRTVFEIAALGTPAIVLAQNGRELTHFFASEAHGFLNLGLAEGASAERIRRAFIEAVEDLDWRQRMHRRMLDNELRSGTARVVQLLESAMEGAWDSPT